MEIIEYAQLLNNTRDDGITLEKKRPRIFYSYYL